MDAQNKLLNNYSKGNGNGKGKCQSVYGHNNTN